MAQAPIRQLTHRLMIAISNSTPKNNMAMSFFVPYARSSTFVDREGILNHISDTLEASYRVTLYGPGGAGYVVFLP